MESGEQETNPEANEQESSADASLSIGNLGVVGNGTT
jgi:hypothetical protein